jgi:hypothetical protein
MRAAAMRAVYREALLSLLALVFLGRLPFLICGQVLAMDQARLQFLDE